MTCKHYIPQLIHPVNRQLLVNPIIKRKEPEIIDGKRSDGRKLEEFRPLSMY